MGLPLYFFYARVALFGLLALSRPAYSQTLGQNVPEPKFEQGSAKSFANVIQPKGENNTIPGLDVLKNKLPVMMVRNGQAFRPVVVVEFKLESLKDKPESRLFVLSGEELIPLPQRKESKTFVLFAFLNGQENEATIVYKENEKAKPLSEKILILAPEAQEFKIVSPWDAIRVALGSTYLFYRQTGYSDFYSWNGLLSVRYTMPFTDDRFGMLAEADYTVLTVKSNQNGWAPQLMSIKADGYYSLASSVSQYRYRVLAGLNYINIFSNGAPFGFKNLIAPSGGIQVRYVKDKNSDYQAHFRLALLDTQLADRGLEFEVSKGLLFKNLHRGEAGFKYLNYSYHTTVNDSNQNTSTATYSIFVSYSL